MKLLMTILVTTTLIYASTIEVKRASVVVKINNKIQKYEVDDIIQLKNNETLCFEKGKGKLLINNEIQISSKSRNKCFKQLNSSSIKNKSLTEAAQSYLDSSEDSVSGMTRSLKTNETNK